MASKTPLLAVTCPECDAALEVRLNSMVVSSMQGSATAVAKKRPLVATKRLLVATKRPLALADATSSSTTLATSSSTTSTTLPPLPPPPNRWPEDDTDDEKEEPPAERTSTKRTSTKRTEAVPPAAETEAEPEAPDEQQWHEGGYGWSESEMWGQPTKKHRW